MARAEQLTPTVGAPATPIVARILTEGAIPWREFDTGQEPAELLWAIGREIISHDMPNEGTVERHDAHRYPVGFGAGPDGGGTLELPARAMPSFSAGPVRLEWRLQMTGTTDGDPIDQRFDIEVVPC